MLMDGLYNQANELEQIHSIQRTIDTVAALLLLTGQVTINGVFVRPGRLSVSIGGRRLEGKNHSRAGGIVIDMIDILLAIFLLNDEINIDKRSRTYCNKECSSSSDLYIRFSFSSKNNICFIGR